MGARFEPGVARADASTASPARRGRPAAKAGPDWATMSYPPGGVNAAGDRRPGGTPRIVRDEGMKRLFPTKYGYFTEDGREYVITRPDTPTPWTNVICPGEYGTLVTQAGTGYSWMTHATLNRLTRWEQDLIRDEWGKYLYCRDRRSGKFWSLAW